MINENKKNDQFLTEVFKQILLFFSYFKENNLTLKQLLIFGLLFLSVTRLTAQNFNNIEFVENKGQWDPRVEYRGQISNGAFFIRNGGFTVVQHNPADFQMIGKFLHGVNQSGNAVTSSDKLVLRSHAWNVDFIGASPQAQVLADKIVPSHNNYFFGTDQQKWASNCRIFQAVTLKDVYPNIDVRYYTDNEFLKYDIIVKPGGDVSKIALKYDGIDKVQVKNKELVVTTSVGDMKESSPYTFQSTTKGKQEIIAKYKVENNIVRFEIKDYDPSQTLVIDPIIVFGSFAGSTADNWGFTATYGPDGSMFGGGIVFDGGGSFPTSPGAFITTFQGGVASTTSSFGFDMGIIKLNPMGTNRVYATYMGGGGNKQPHSLVVDNAGNLVIAGRTNSSNYPVNNG